MKQNTNIETWVGAFLLLGIALVCTLIIIFGEAPDFLKPTYKLTITFPNAAGLLKGSDVYLSGALIGKVTTDPQPVPDTQTVKVNLKINKEVGIRTDATYVIGSAGLLGDKFVEVRPYPYKEGTPESDKKPFLKDGDPVEGAKNVGIDEIIDTSKPLIDRANHIAAQLDDMITRLNTDVLSGTSTDDLKETIAKLRHMVDNGDSMITNANDLLSQAKSGKGILSRLINDKKTADDFSALIANMKTHGPIFYHDDSADKDAASSADKDKSDGKKKKGK